MSVLLVIPARGGSKTIPRKNLADVAGRPLISYAIENALAAKLEDRVIVSTEDPEIAETARSWGAEVPFERPQELAGDEVSLVPVVAHAMRTLDEQDWHATAVVSLQPTAPFVRAGSLDAGIRLLLDSGCDSVVSVRRVEHNHPYWIQELDAEHRIRFANPEGERFLQKQDLPPFYFLCGCFYVRRRRLLEEWSGRDFGLGRDRRAVVVDAREALDIDTPVDLALCRTLMVDPPANESATRDS